MMLAKETQGFMELDEAIGLLAAVLHVERMPPMPIARTIRSAPTRAWRRCMNRRFQSPMRQLILNRGHQVRSSPVPEARTTIARS